MVSSTASGSEGWGGVGPTAPLRRPLALHEDAPGAVRCVGLSVLRSVCEIGAEQRPRGIPRRRSPFTGKTQGMKQMGMVKGRRPFAYFLRQTNAVIFGGQKNGKSDGPEIYTTRFAGCICSIIW